MEIIQEKWGLEHTLRWYSFHNTDRPEVVDCTKIIHANIKPQFGQCMMLSAMLAFTLRDNYNIPAIPIAGNLFVNNQPVFRMSGPLPTFKDGVEKIHLDHWAGHCWVDIGGRFADISIFRTAYDTQGSPPLTSFIKKKFGNKKGAIYWGYDEAEEAGLRYQPIEAMSESLMHACVNGLKK